MAEAAAGGGTYPYQNTAGMEYPLTKMNFVVQVENVEGAHAAFSQVTGLDATVDVIEFRQGNANSLSPVKIPGLVKHGNVTLRFGYTIGSGFKTWIQNCVTSNRTTATAYNGGYPRHNVSIELIDIRASTPANINTTVGASGTSSGTAQTWVLTNAWVTKYTAPELDAKTSDVAIESVEIAYEELTIPN